MNATALLRKRAQVNVRSELALRGVTKVHGKGERAVVALDGINVDLAPGSFTAIMGPSGSGKSTFLHVAAGLDKPTSGSVFLGDKDLARMSERRLTILRRKQIGFVFQAFNLMPSLTVAQNIGLPLRLDGRRARRADVRGVAARVGLDKRLRHRPAQAARAGSSSASRLRARSSRGPRPSSLTSRPGRSTSAPGARCSACFESLLTRMVRRWSWSPRSRGRDVRRSRDPPRGRAGRRHARGRNR